MYRFDAPLFFANCRRLRDDVLELVRAAPDPVTDSGPRRWVPSRSSTPPHRRSSFSSSKRLGDVGTSNLSLPGLTVQVRDILAASGVADALGPDGIAPTVRAAIEARRNLGQPTDPDSMNRVRAGPLNPKASCGQCRIGLNGGASRQRELAVLSKRSLRDTLFESPCRGVMTPSSRATDILGGLRLRAPMRIRRHGITSVPRGPSLHGFETRKANVRERRTRATRFARPESMVE